MAKYRIACCGKLPFASCYSRMRASSTYLTLSFAITFTFLFSQLKLWTETSDPLIDPWFFSIILSENNTYPLRSIVYIEHLSPSNPCHCVYSHTFSVVHPGRFSSHNLLIDQGWQIRPKFDQFGPELWQIWDF